MSGQSDENLGQKYRIDIGAYVGICSGTPAEGNAWSFSKKLLGQGSIR